MYILEIFKKLLNVTKKNPILYGNKFSGASTTSMVTRRYVTDVYCNEVNMFMSVIMHV